LRLRLKQGSQQLKLWIQRVTLLFKTYTETPITTNQQTRITDWLNTWDSATVQMTVTQDDSDVDMTYTDTGSARDATDTGCDHSQTNITNWLKSWSQEDSTQDSITVLGEEFSTSLGF
jgi:Tfp pilus assembly protein PilV